MEMTSKGDGSGVIDDIRDPKSSTIVPSMVDPPELSSTSEVILHTQEKPVQSPKNLSDLPSEDSIIQFAMTIAARSGRVHVKKVCRRTTRRS